MADARPEESRGRHVRRWLPSVLALTTGVPLLVLGYLAYGLRHPAALDGRGLGAAVLVVGAVLGIVAGGWLITALSRPVSQAGRDPGTSPPGRDPDQDPAGTARLQATIAQQAAEIARQHDRLAEVLKELETTNARLKETSFKDELTSLYNRRFFFVRLEEEISRHRRFGHPVAVVLFDLDGFKEVNDEQGHMIGDETLRDIGQVLMKYSRGINVVARYGGDEFAILLVETSKAGASLYAERIRQILSTHPYSHRMRVTASFGVASLPEDEAATSEDLVRIADEALYVAKRGGKNQVAGTPPPEDRGA